MRAVLGPPYVSAAMAVGTVITELLLAALLFVPNWRVVGLWLGAGFHVVVPIVGKVAPDLNFVLVATYLFFVSGASLRDGRLYRHPAVRWYLGMWLYYLLPLEPWPWVSMPFIAGLSVLVIGADWSTRQASPSVELERTGK